ncbi:MAG: FAD-dependent oxidoreductase [Victivallales bacterium]|nr:FAD-dependent oxidoreductase [Victivallales bacterium]
MVEKKIPTLETDVLVIGAGPGGLGAALMSARSGQQTLVAEAYGVPGGMAVIAEVHPFMVSSVNGQDLDAPVYPEWKAAMRRYLTPQANAMIERDGGYAPRSINKAAAALAAEDLLLSAGVRMLYHHRLVDTEMEGRNIRACILHSKGGLRRVRAKMYIDCTGDADLAASAGCRFDVGDEHGRCQPMTLCFKLANVQAKYTDEGKALRLLDPEWRKMLDEKYQNAVRSGRVHCEREDVLLFPYSVGGNGVLHFNTTRVLRLSALDGDELAQAEIEGRRQLRELLFWLREDVPGFAEAELLSMGIQIGVRESRRVKGIFTLTREDFERAAKFPDAIARSNYHIDIHSPDGSGTYRQSLPPDEYYEIPYGCIVPEDCDNLLIGGRPVSSDMAVHSSLRIMPTAISLGQAAGCAASLAIQEKKAPRNLNGTAVRACLCRMGAMLGSLLLFLAAPLLGGEKTTAEPWSIHSGRVFIVRHGQRDKPLPPAYDPLLTADGRRQATLAGKELKRRGFRGVIWASPYRRTLETATLIAHELGDPPIHLAPLSQEYCRHPGKPNVLPRSLAEMKAEFGLLQGTEEIGDWRLSGPEDLLAVKMRVARMLEKMPPKPETQDWLFVTHGAVIKGFHLLSVGYMGGKLPDMPMNWNACLSEYRFFPGFMPLLVSLFDVGFLPDELTTSNERSKQEVLQDKGKGEPLSNPMR